MPIDNSSNSLQPQEEAAFENKHSDVFLKQLEEQLQIRTAALLVAHELELDYQVIEKNLKQDELDIANKELKFENEEKEKRAAELLVANVELQYQNVEKKKREDELSVANIELVFQNKEKKNRAAELNIANIELAYQNSEKEKRAAELVVANLEVVYQNREKAKRSAELNIANIELVYENGEKEKRSAELKIANIELVYQNGEKERRSAELKIANIELIFQNGEKEKRAAELVIANIELSFQNSEKEKRASELKSSKIANVALIFQILEKEKEASELIIANKELAAFNYISSHDLQEPINKIKFFIDRLMINELANLSPVGLESLMRIQRAANRMETLIADLLEYSKTSSQERKFEKIDLHNILQEVVSELSEKILEKQATVEAEELGEVYINISQFRQVLTNLLTNALKFSKPGIAPNIILTGKLETGADCMQANAELEKESLVPNENYYHLQVSDNGIGYEPKYNKKVFEIFQRLHSKHEYKGSGIGLAIVKKIIENHSGKITSNSTPGSGTYFNIYLPTFKEPTTN